jgi:hypothetical protein
VHEFLFKPTSPKALRDRLLALLLCPRPMVQIANSTGRNRGGPLAPDELRQAA